MLSQEKKHIILAAESANHRAVQSARQFPLDKEFEEALKQSDFILAQFRNISISYMRGVSEEETKQDLLELVQQGLKPFEFKG